MFSLVLFYLIERSSSTSHKKLCNSLILTKLSLTHLFMNRFLWKKIKNTNFAQTQPFNLKCSRPKKWEIRNQIGLSPRQIWEWRTRGIPFKITPPAAQSGVSPQSQNNRDGMTDPCLHFIVREIRKSDVWRAILNWNLMTIIKKPSDH